jgi:hypothetical protein
VRRSCNLLLLLAVLIGTYMPGTAAAAESVSLHATLTPERLGQGTTIGFALEITAPAGQVPSPLTGVDVRYPNNLGIALSGLGLETCSQQILEVLGSRGCPVDSRMGYGSALAKVPIGPEGVSEGASIAVLRAPDQEGHLALFLYTESITPVLAQLVLPGLLLAAKAPFGGLINVNVPLVPSVPGGADVSVIQLQATFGPEHLTYTEKVHGRTVTYVPKGILLPDRCPRGGFPFAATLAFLDGSRASARTAVPCPRSSSRPRRSGPRSP